MSDLGDTPPLGGDDGAAKPPPASTPSRPTYESTTPATPPPPAPPSGSTDAQTGGEYAAPAPAYTEAPAGAPVAQPKSIATAVKLMYVGAGLSILSALAVLFMGDTIRESAAETAREAGNELSQSQLDGAVAIGVGGGIFAGIVGALLWVFMAWANGNGRSWARIVASILFGISVVSTLFSLTQPQPIMSRLLSFISLVLGGYIIYLLFRPESTQFYQSRSAQRV